MTTAPKSIALIEALEYIVEFEQRVQTTARSDIAAAQDKLYASVTNEEAWLSAIEVPACCELVRPRRALANAEPTERLRVYRDGAPHTGQPLVVVTLDRVDVSCSTQPLASGAQLGEWSAYAWPHKPQLDLRARSLSALRGRVLLALAQLGLIPWQTETPDE